MTSSPDESVALVRDFFDQITGIPAETGRLDDNDDIYGDPKVDGNPNRLWARINGNRRAIPVWNNGSFIVDDGYAPINVMVRLNQGGEWEICGGDARKADIALGKAAGTKLSARRQGRLVQEEVPGRNLVEGRVGLWVRGTLNVNAEPFLYMDSNGDERLWTPIISTNLDLADSVPAQSGGVDQQQWVRIALNPDATTPALVAFAGTSQSAASTIAPRGWADIPIPDGYIPLDSVVLQTGDVDETTVGEARWAFAKHFLAPITRGGYAAATTTDATVTTLASIAVAEVEMVTVEGVVSAMKSDASAGAMRSFRIAVRRASGGNVTLIGAITYGEAIQEDSGGTPALTADVDTGTQSIRVRIQGIAAETWNWRVRWTKVATS